MLNTLNEGLPAASPVVADLGTKPATERSPILRAHGVLREEHRKSARTQIQTLRKLWEKTLWKIL
jgi:hypothetical protein